MSGFESFLALWLGGASPIGSGAIVDPPVEPPVEPAVPGDGDAGFDNALPPTFPFERIVIDHMFYGTTRVWWRLDALFTMPGPHTYTLQASYVGIPGALDWVNLTTETNVSFLTYDTTRELTGKHLLTHFRVVLDSGEFTFYSQAAPIWGIMSQRNWTLAREILRKYALHQDEMAVDGYLLRRMRYGEDAKKILDTLTGTQLTSFHKPSWGTPFQVGYHPPVAFRIEMDPRAMVEYRGGADPEHYSEVNGHMVASAVAFPQIILEDVWVNKYTDERWRVGQITQTSTLQGVPLIIKAEFELIPHNDIVYQIPVDEWSYDPVNTTDDALPISEGGSNAGKGCVRVDHDYPGDDDMVYMTADCCYIEGANIWVFTKEDWDNGNRTVEYAVATSITTTGGRWAYAVMLDPGEYVVQFELPGRYGPDIVELTVTGNVPDSSSIMESESIEDPLFGSATRARLETVDNAYGMF